MAIGRIAYREMAEQSIAKTFRGILRVANIQECTNQEEDFYFNPIYYGTPSGGISNEDAGYNSAHPALNGNLTRYIFENDPYKDKKVPVTDSMGNYLNINVGANGVTFGSDELNNGNNADKVTYTQPLNNTQFVHEEIFPVLKSANLIIGLEGRVLPEEKNYVNGGTVAIESSPYSDTSNGQLIIYNNYDHSPSHLQDDGRTYIPISTIDSSKTYRTIYQITNDVAKDYDALVHYQDNIDIHNLTVNHHLDTFVDILNLKDYVKEKLDLYMASNTVEMPPGTVIWQYVSLTKWYSFGELNGTTWAGNQPPMGTQQDIDVFTPSLYQGVVRKGINRLVALSHEIDPDDPNEFKTEGIKQLQEIIPIYKRDYAICDGSTFTIHMMMPEDAGMTDYVSYDQFINLFFAIGYQYTDFSVIRPHYANQKQGDIYCWKDGARAASTDCQNKDVLFGIDLVSMLAIKVIFKELKEGSDNNGRSACLDNTENVYSRANAEAWLKNQPLPKEFIFNTNIPSASGGIQFVYRQPNLTTNPNPPKYSFALGREVNSFNSDIYYYDHGSKSYVICKVWQTAEIQGVLDLFLQVNLSRERELYNYYTYSFQIPNFVQHVEGKYDAGTFLGFSPFVWAEENLYSSQIETVTHFTSSTYPHRHVIFMGPPAFKSTPSITYNTGEVDAASMARAEGVENWFTNCQPSIKRGDWNTNAYTFAEVSGLKYEDQVIDGVPTKVIQCENVTRADHPDPRWRNAEPNRGLTSTPIISNSAVNEKYAAASANSATGETLYFNPENCGLIPLIKL